MTKLLTWLHPNDFEAGSIYQETDTGQLWRFVEWCPAAEAVGKVRAGTMQFLIDPQYDEDWKHSTPGDVGLRSVDPAEPVLLFTLAADENGRLIEDGELVPFGRISYEQGSTFRLLLDAVLDDLEVDR